ncbi:hypothetical protein [Streptomyces sp. NPDC057302]|uniref:hypothetical protein n=1 Tax=Streptomyces sp. NPDC057302 TaxID=3346094 RepID=UPI0036421686
MADDEVIRDEREYEDDALLLALMDEPLPEAAGRDPELAAEHAAAVADVALLREAIGAAGRRLAEPEPEPGPEPVPKPMPLPVRPAGVRRRRLTLALGVAAATAAVSLVGGVLWRGMESGGGINKSSADADSGSDSRSGSAKDAAPEAGDQKSGAYGACARLIVEGTVRRVEPVPGGVQDRIVLDVTRYYKPSQGAKRVTFVMDVNVDPRLRPGDRALIGIPKGEASPDIWSKGVKDLARDRAWIERELRLGKGMKC